MVAVWAVLAVPDLRKVVVDRPLAGVAVVTQLPSDRETEGRD